MLPPCVISLYCPVESRLPLITPSDTEQTRWWLVVYKGAGAGVIMPKQLQKCSECETLHVPKGGKPCPYDIGCLPVPLRAVKTAVSLLHFSIFPFFVINKWNIRNILTSQERQGSGLAAHPLGCQRNSTFDSIILVILSIFLHTAVTALSWHIYRVSELDTCSLILNPC